MKITLRIEGADLKTGSPKLFQSAMDKDIATAVKAVREAYLARLPSACAAADTAWLGKWAILERKLKIAVDGPRRAKQGTVSIEKQMEQNRQRQARWRQRQREERDRIRAQEAALRQALAANPEGRAALESLDETRASLLSTLTQG